jgi:hypothetical protein
MTTIAFPVYLLAKDDGSVMRFGSLREMRGYLEAIDVSNKEYEAWDVRGRCLTLMVENSKHDWLVISPTSHFAAESDFAEICKKASDFPLKI